MIEEVYSRENLDRAWLWLKSNPDRMFKQHFRDSYRNFEAIREDLISSVALELEHNTYTPSPACKIFFPKPSGILRPYSLLTVKDQLVYQAFANVIAERLLPITRPRYDKKIFGNQYAGVQSTWFYKRWSKCFARYNKAAQQAFEDGKIFSASFDLTACYDTIDHGVLSHFLAEIGCSVEFNRRVCSYLSLWTATHHEDPIYQHHGIPQGPLSSGILSEVILKAFDDERLIDGVSYFRYVDDIKLFSASETKLRSELVRLDTVSKKIGLFPQSSKIGIHKIKNMDEELQSLSHPGSLGRQNFITQNMVNKKIITATHGLEIKNISLLRYYTAVSAPNKFLIDRLWVLYGKYPHIYEILCKVLKKCETLPKESYVKILQELNKKNPYDAIYAEFISVMYETQLTNNQIREVSRLVKDKFYGTGRGLLNGETILSCAVCKILIKFNALTDRQINFIVGAPKWQTRIAITEELGKRGDDVLDTYLTRLAGDPNDDVSLVACSGIIKKHLQSPVNVRPFAGNYMQVFGRNIVADDVCYVQNKIFEILRVNNSEYQTDWNDLLAEEYLTGVEEIVRCSTSLSTNVRFWITELDNFNEIVMRKFAVRDGTIGEIGANYGRIFAEGSLFQNTYPVLHDAARAIHDRRSTSVHTYGAQRQRNKPFKHAEVSAYVELEKAFVREIVRLLN